MILIISMSFSLCIYIMMQMNYEMRVILIYAYIGAATLDILLLRNFVLLTGGMSKAILGLISTRINAKNVK